MVQVRVGKYFLAANILICLFKDMLLCHNRPEFSCKGVVSGGEKQDFSLRFEMTAGAGGMTAGVGGLALALSGTMRFLAGASK